MLQSLRELGTEDSLSFSFGGRIRTFYVLNIPNKNIRQFQERVSAFACDSCQAPRAVPPRLSSLPEMQLTCFIGGKGIGKGQFDSPTGIAVDGNGNVLVADTGNGRIEKFSANWHFSQHFRNQGLDTDNSKRRMGSQLIALATFTCGDSAPIIACRNWLPTALYRRVERPRARILWAAKDRHWP